MKNLIYDEFCKRISFVLSPFNVDINSTKLMSLINSNFPNDVNKKEIFNELSAYIKICAEINEIDPKNVNRVISEIDMWNFFINIGSVNTYTNHENEIVAQGITPHAYKTIRSYFNFNKHTEFNLAASKSLKK